MHGNDAATCMKIIQPNPWKVLRDRRKAQCAQFVAEVGTASPPLQVHQSGMEMRLNALGFRCSFEPAK